jgi:hemerythrin-like domain-containing protein
MKATRELRDEHEGIRLMLRILDAVATRLEAGQSVPRKDLDAIIEFLAVFADKCHHAKEEEYLFPALEKAGVPRERGPIGVMLAEHSKGRGFIADLKAAVAGVAAQDRGSIDSFARAARDYIDLLRAHIDKENNVLFPMAESRLGDPEDAALVETFEKLERERIGPGKHEEFHAVLKRLKDTYLQ